MNVVKTTNLTKYYGKKQGVLNVNISIDKGEALGIAGAAGSGKSTLVRLLSGILRSSNGKAIIFGMDIAKRKKSILRDTGIVPPSAYFYENMRVQTLLRYTACLYGKSCKKRMRELADMFELDLSLKIGDLSYSGMRKTAIIQGFMHSPKLLLLDDPTEGLTQSMCERFEALLLSEKSKGVSILLSTNSLSMLQQTCDKVTVIKDGKIINEINNPEVMDSFREAVFKKISLTVRQSIPDGYFSLPSVKNLQQKENKSVSFLYYGIMSDVMNKISALDYKDLSVNNANTGEYFKHYGGGLEGSAQGGAE